MIWLMALVITTSIGDSYMGVLHDKQGRLVRFHSEEACEKAARVILQRANEQRVAGKMDPEITGANFTCYQPVGA